MVLTIIRKPCITIICVILTIVIRVGFAVIPPPLKFAVTIICVVPAIMLLYAALTVGPAPVLATRIPVKLL